MKTHYATLESAANESDNNDYWSDSICGTPTENISDDWKVVDCKKCLKSREEHEKYMKQAMEDNIRDMAGFVEFMEKQEAE